MVQWPVETVPFSLEGGLLWVALWLEAIALTGEAIGWRRLEAFDFRI